MQVGGLLPCVKAAASGVGLPLTVSLADGGFSTSAAALLDAHVILIYTGKTRLARDLLQRVLRQWALRDNGVTSLVRSLRENAQRASDAVRQGSALALGSAVDTYWAQKKAMAPGAEPEAAASIIAVLRAAGAITGASLAGAGGGGFLVAIASTPGGNAVGTIEAVLRSHPATAGMGWSVHAASVDRGGLTVVVDA